jgi:Bacterial Ig domain
MFPSSRVGHSRDPGGPVIPGLLVVALVVVALPGGILLGPAATTASSVPSPPTTQEVPADPSREQPPAIAGRAPLQLLLDPTESEVAVDEPLGYTARLLVRVSRYQASTDVTRWTRFAISPSGTCEKVVDKVSCRAGTVGPHTVLAVLPPGALPIVRYQLEATAALTVRPRVDHLELEPAEASIVLGSSRSYQAFAVDETGGRREVTDQTAFTISPSGECSQASCTPTQAGDSTVTGRLALRGRASITAEAVLHVEPVVASLRLTPESAQVVVGHSRSYAVDGFTADGRPVGPGEVTARPVLTLTKEGRPSGDCDTVSCTPARLGEHIVTATLTQTGRDPVTATATLTAVPGEPTTLRLDPATAEIPAGTSQDYKALGIDERGSDMDLTAQTDFQIEDPGSCDGASCTATRAGVYEVTGTLRGHRRPLSGTARLRVVPGGLAGIKLAPDEAKVKAGTEQAYTVTGVDQYGNERPDDLTGQTSLSIDPPGACVVAGAKVSCTRIGSYTVTGTLTGSGLSDTARLTVERGAATVGTTTTTTTRSGTTTRDTTTTSRTSASTTTSASTSTSTIGGGTASSGGGTTSSGGTSATSGTTTTGRTTTTGATTTTGGTTTTVPASQPAISSVQPGFTFAGMPVEVGGNTGSCSRAGTLIFHGDTGDVSVKVTADRQRNFVARLRIPKGTFPRTHRLELAVDCNGQPQRAQADLSVLNIAPSAANDSARTIQDTPVSIPVTDNDRNPDPDTGYATLVLVSGTPSHGTAEAQTDRSIVYTPEPGFVGQDRFQYSLCDDVLNAAGTADCGTATVTVTVRDAQACQPSPGSISSIKVNPLKGPGGMTLGISATVDRKLAACPFRLLLGGTALSPDVTAGPDGSITAERRVPKDAKPGPSPIRLATMRAQTLAQAQFEVVPSGLRLPLKLLIGAGALAAGALARIAVRRWRAFQDERRRRRLGELPDDLRAEPHTRPVDVTVETRGDGTRTFAVRLEPHPDPGNQTLWEVTR